MSIRRSYKSVFETYQKRTLDAHNQRKFWKLMQEIGTTLQKQDWNLNWPKRGSCKKKEDEIVRKAVEFLEKNDFYSVTIEVTTSSISAEKTFSLSQPFTEL